jgi:dTDP-4-dehydrorhamnose reductase
MRLFVTGISGLLGSNIAHALRQTHQVHGCYHHNPWELEGVTSQELDLLSYAQVEKALDRAQPDLVVHTAALTNVESCEANPDMAYALNVNTALHVAKACQILETRMIHISSDHLFDGKSPWKTEEDAPQPLNVYASTKAQAEQAVLQSCSRSLVVRTNFYGQGRAVKPSFSDWILGALRRSESLTMFTDSFFTPILMDDLIGFMLELARREAEGIFNVVGRERLSKHEFAIRLARSFNLSAASVRTASLQDAGFKAVRPLDMSLSSEKVQRYLGVPMPSVSQGLDRLLRLSEVPGVR